MPDIIVAIPNSVPRVLNGTDGDDTLVLLVEEINLRNVTLNSIEAIDLADGRGVDLTVADLAQALLIRSANASANDRVHIHDFKAGDVENRMHAVFEILSTGVETVTWGRDGSETTATLTGQLAIPDTLVTLDRNGIQKEFTFFGNGQTQTIRTEDTLNVDEVAITSFVQFDQAGQRVVDIRTAEISEFDTVHPTSTAKRLSDCFYET